MEKSKWEATKSLKPSYTEVVDNSGVRVGSVLKKKSRPSFSKGPSRKASTGHQRVVEGRAAALGVSVEEYQQYYPVGGFDRAAAEKKSMELAAEMIEVMKTKSSDEIFEQANAAILSGDGEEGERLIKEALSAPDFIGVDLGEANIENGSMK